MQKICILSYSHVIRLQVTGMEANYSCPKRLRAKVRQQSYMGQVKNEKLYISNLLGYLTLNPYIKIPSLFSLFIAKLIRHKWNKNSNANWFYTAETMSPTDSRTDKRTDERIDGHRAWWVQYTPNQLRCMSLKTHNDGGIQGPKYQI